MALTWTFDVAEGLNVATGVALAVFGLWVWAKGRSSPIAPWFLAFTLLFGLGAAYDSIFRMFGAGDDKSLVASWPLLGSLMVEEFEDLVVIGAIVALVGLTLRTPPALGPWRRREIVTLGATFGAIAAFVVARYAYRILAEGLLEPFGPVRAVILTVIGTVGAFDMLRAGLAACAVALAGRFARSADDDPERETALMAMALAAYPMAVWGTFLADAARGDVARMLQMGAAGVTALAGVVAWLRVAHGPNRRLATWVAWSFPTLFLLGYANDVWGLGNSAFLARLVMIPIMGYIVVRHSLVGADVKVRWVVGKSVLAAFLIVIFFVLSEAAQTFFSDTTGSEYLGILVTGGLVFAFMPLQRAAERFAETALPSGSGPTEGDDESLFRWVAQRIKGDASLDRERRAGLARLADRLDLGASRTVEVLDELADDDA